VSISFVSTTQDQVGNSTTTVSKPTGVVVGDVLLWLVSNDQSGGTVTITTPTGFTLIGTVFSNTNGTNRTVSQGVYYRVVDGTEGTTFSATGTATAGGPIMYSIMVAYRGADPVSPIDTSSRNSGNATGTTITATGVTVSATGNWVIGTLSCWEADNGPLSTLTERVNSGGNGQTVDDASYTAGPTGNLTCSCSATELWTVALTVLRAAAPRNGIFFGAGTTS
jgi:hypothetical protein